MLPPASSQPNLASHITSLPTQINTHPNPSPPRTLPLRGTHTPGTTFRPSHLQTLHQTHPAHRASRMEMLPQQCTHGSHATQSALSEPSMWVPIVYCPRYAQTKQERQGSLEEAIRGLRILP